MNVWQISQELQRVDEAIERGLDDTGEVSEELGRAYQELVEIFTKDSEGVAELIRKKKAEADMFKAQAVRFRDEATKLEKAADTMKRSVMVALEAMGTKKHGSFSVCANGGVLPLILTDEIPEEFIKYEPKQDTDAIRAALDKGDLPFAKYGERGKHIRVRAT
jgi:hypothetical protein